MIYINDNTEIINVEKSLSQLSKQRRERVLKFRNDSSKKLSIAAYLLLRDALNKEFGITTLPEFSFSKDGKPFLNDYPEIFFSFSHSKNVAICAIDTQPIGADIEVFRDIGVDMINYSMNDKEQQIILSSANQSATFLKIWTQKESVFKLIGTGIDNNLKNILNNNTKYSIESFETDKMVYSIAKYI